MARGVNKVILIGSVGKDPESRNSVTALSMATSESWKDKNTGEKQERTEWHNVSFFKELGDIVLKYVKKGSKIYVEGKLKTDKYTDKEGIERYRTNIIANTMQMLDSKKESNNETNASNSSKRPRFDGEQTQSFDDDIPF